MTRIAIIGPGALGGTLAAWLTQNPEHDVVLCARTGFSGLVADTPNGQISANPNVLTDPDQASEVDWVLIATKTYDSEGALPWLKRLVGTATRIAVIQNGVEHVARFAKLLPGRDIVPAIADIPAGRTAPGRVVQRALGSIVVPDTKDGGAFTPLFSHTPIDVQTSNDWTTRAWQKLCLNCAGAFPALTMRSTGPVWNDEVETLVRGLVTECADVGRAEGANISNETIDSVVTGARNAPDRVGNSLYADRMEGRPMEVDARNGVIVRLGQKHNIPTPVNALFVTLLTASGSPWTQK